MGKDSRARKVNGVVSAALTLFFLAHATIGGISLLTGFASPFAVLVWVGVGLVAVHVVASVVTSREQLGDVERPPSARKKRHLALKWATGIALLATAAFHIVSMRMPVATAPSLALDLVAIVVVAVALAAHLWVGSKSLLKDLGLNTRHQPAFRAAVCLFAVFFVVSAIMGAAGAMA